MTQDKCNGFRACGIFPFDASALVQSETKIGATLSSELTPTNISQESEKSANIIAKEVIE